MKKGLITFAALAVALGLVVVRVERAMRAREAQVAANADAILLSIEERRELDREVIFRVEVVNSALAHYSLDEVVLRFPKEIEGLREMREKATPRVRPRIERFLEKVDRSRARRD